MPKDDSGSIHNVLPHKFTIPIPVPDPRPRGVFSLGALSIAYSVRFDAPTLERIRELADQLEISPGEFVRWSATKLAEQMDKHLEQHNERKTRRTARSNRHRPDSSG